MKKFLFFWMAALALVVGGALVACSQDESLGTDPEPDFYTVQLGWGGEIVDIAYEPLDTRATTDDLYGIQVYSKPNNNSTATSWEPYAYGVFDDPTDISIDLASGNKYKFVATMVVDAKNRIANLIEGDQEGNHYAAPFNVFFDDIGTFISKEENRSIDSAYSYVVDSEGKIHTYETPNLDRYYGEVEDLVPSNSNTDITISMKRVSFGAKFIAEGALAKSGTLVIQMQGAPQISLALTEGEDSHSDIYTVSQIRDIWLKAIDPDNIAVSGLESNKISFKWIRPDETELQIGTFPITFKRNTTTVVTVKMENDVVVGDIEGGVGFSIASTEKGDMPVDEDNSVTIVDGEVEE